VLLVVLLLAAGDYPAKVVVTALVLAGGAWSLGAVVVRERAIRPVQTIANMIAGLREGDFSIRGRGASARDDLGLAFLELNALGETLRQQRLGALEAHALLRRLMAEVDVAVVAFDEGARVRLANRYAERLLGLTQERLVGRTAAELALAPFLDGDAAGVRDAVFAGRTGRWGYRRGGYRQGGRPHVLLVLADLSEALRDEERQAWQRLIRVLGHEINNSLAPIKSVAQSLQTLVARGAVTGEGSADLAGGLALIGTRAEALARFLAAYAALARLPPPRRAPMEVAAWVRRTAGLETRLAVTVVPGPPATIEADADQLDQALINLVRNAADAVEQGAGSREQGAGSREQGSRRAPRSPLPAASITWSATADAVTVTLADNGPGLPETANLFVPFFTTKPGGTGIGLVLARQIVEAHGGTLTVRNRSDGPGTEALLTLPVGHS
jgi:PAS domain S-box-containing protein